MDVPQIFKEDLSGWNWTIPDCPNLAVLEKFEAALEQLQRMLKENIAIDRRAASFFRIATKPIGVSQGTAAHQRIKLTADYLLDEKADNIEETDVYYLADVGEMARGMQSWEEKVIMWSTPQESTLVPKDTLSLSKDFPLFIKKCVKCIYTVPLPVLLKDNSLLYKYRTEELPLIEQSFNPVTVWTAVEIPESLPVRKSSDLPLLEELLSEEAEFEAIYRRFEDPEPSLLIAEAHYALDIREVELPISFSVGLSYPQWVCCPPYVNHELVSSVETYLLDEEINKGAEFRIDGPFMTDEPTFKEPRTPVEYSIPQLPAEMKVNRSLEKGINYHAENLDEALILHEDIGLDIPEAHSKLYQRPSPILHKVELLIGRIHGSPVTSRKHVITESPIPQHVSLNEDSITQPTFMQETTIHIDQSNQALAETSNTHSTALNEQDTLAATKMSTQATITIQDVSTTTSLKRSIDDDIDTLISKRKRQTSEKRHKKRPPILDLLRGGTTTPDSTIDPGADTTTILPPSVEICRTFNAPYRQCTHTIGFNASFTKRLQTHLSKLSQITNLNVLEFDMDGGDVEFIISAQCGVMIVDISLLGQCDPQGNMVLHDRVLRSKIAFDELIVLVQMGYITKREDIAALQLSLGLLGAEVIVVQNDSENLSDWICEIATQRGRDLSIDDLQMLEQGDTEFLVSCGLNPFTALEVLKTKTLLEFVSLDYSDRSILKSLNDNQRDNLEILFNTEWSSFS